MPTIKANRVTQKPTAARSVGFVLNGEYHSFNVGGHPHEISPTHTLSWTLRETLGLTGTKISCEQGACGCCTVIMDGKAVLSCRVLTVECDGKTITTIEGLRDSKTGALDPIQQAFVDHTAFQCGYCTPGMIMTVKAFLDENPRPTEEEIEEALAGNFCRCISHYQVIKAVKSAVDDRT